MITDRQTNSWQRKHRSYLEIQLSLFVFVIIIGSNTARCMPNVAWKVVRQKYMVAAPLSKVVCQLPYHMYRQRCPGYIHTHTHNRNYIPRHFRIQYS